MDVDQKGISLIVDENGEINIDNFEEEMAKNILNFIINKKGKSLQGFSYGFDIFKYEYESSDNIKLNLKQNLENELVETFSCLDNVIINTNIDEKVENKINISMIIYYTNNNGIKKSFEILYKIKKDNDELTTSILI